MRQYQWYKTQRRSVARNPRVPAVPGSVHLNETLLSEACSLIDGRLRYSQQSGLTGVEVTSGMIRDSLGAASTDRATTPPHQRLLLLPFKGPPPHHLLAAADRARRSQREGGHMQTRLMKGMDDVGPRR
jgi:hypothetical protein